MATIIPDFIPAHSDFNDSVDIWDQLHWEKPLTNFADASSLTVSLYQKNDSDWIRRAGPFTRSKLGEHLRQTGAWDGGFAWQEEQSFLNSPELSQILRRDNTLRSFSIFKIPLEFEGAQGALVGGWTVDHFSDSFESQRLSEILGVSREEAWAVLRSSPPMRPDKIKTYFDLLSTLAHTLCQQLNFRQRELNKAHAVAVLNSYLSSIATAESVQELKELITTALTILTGKKVHKINIISNNRKVLAKDQTNEAISLKIKSSFAHIAAVVIFESEIEEFKQSEIYELFNSQITVALDRYRLKKDLEKKTVDLEKLLEDLRQANVAKDVFLATLSHELRTPLNAILGWLQLFKRGILTKEQKESALDTIERNARMQGALIEELLDMSRIISEKVTLNPETISACLMVQELAYTMAPLAETKKIHFKAINLIEGDACLRGDKQRVAQVLTNVLNNAIKFTPQGGEVTFSAYLEEKMIVFECKDSGAGISAEFLPKIFDRFSQADGSFAKKQGGLGLGLAISKHLVSLHGGKITAYSEGPKKGSVFKVELPAEDKDQFAEIEEPSSIHSSNEQLAKLINKKILIVEDTVDSLEMMMFALSAAGASVQGAKNAAEGYQLFKSFKPEVIISDIGLPGEDGVSFLKNLKKLPEFDENRIKAIAVSGYSRLSEQTAILNSGFFKHLSKPVNLNVLIDILGKI